MAVERQDGRHVAAAIAVVGRAPHRAQVLVREVELEAFHHQLVRPADQLDLVVVHELQYRVRVGTAASGGGGGAGAVLTSSVTLYPKR
jgi:hypothetical protein